MKTLKLILLVAVLHFGLIGPLPTCVMAGEANFGCHSSAQACADMPCSIAAPDTVAIISEVDLFWSPQRAFQSPNLIPLLNSPLPNLPQSHKFNKPIIGINDAYIPKSLWQIKSKSIKLQC